MTYETAAAIVLTAIPCIFAYIVINLKQEEVIKEEFMLPLRVLLFFTSLFMLTLIMQYGVVLAEDASASTDIQRLLGTGQKITMWISIIGVAYVFLLILLYAVKVWRNKKNKSIFDDGDDD